MRVLDEDGRGTVGDVIAGLDWVLGNGSPSPRVRVCWTCRPPSALHLHTVTVGGLPDMKAKLRFWAQDFSFPGVKDGDLLSIDKDLSVQLYRGEPADFLNLYVLAVRSKKASRDFAAVLKENMMAQHVAPVRSRLASAARESRAQTCGRTRSVKSQQAASRLR